jgi:predicted MFS family arabinose efflux permease
MSHRGVQAAFGLVAQLTQTVMPIGAVLVVEAATGSLALAGLAAGAFSFGVGMARPVQGRLVDRRGPRLVLVATGCLHAVAVIALTVTGGPGWALIGLAWIAGVGMPPVSVAMRIEAQRTPPERRTAAYSTIFLVQELAVLAGPLLFGGIVAVASAPLALAVTGVAAGAGTFALAYVMRGARPAPAARGGGVIRNRRMRLLLAVTVLVGGAIGVMEVGLPALASARGVPAASGPLLAAVSLGGIAGALCYGRLRWTARPAMRLVILLFVVGLALAPDAYLGALAAVGGALFVMGVALNPALTTASLLVDELEVAPAEAFGWLSTAIGVGAAAGGGIAGTVAEYAGPPRTLLLASLLAMLGAALSLLLARR